MPYLLRSPLGRLLVLKELSGVGLEGEAESAWLFHLPTWEFWCGTPISISIPSLWLRNSRSLGELHKGQLQGQDSGAACNTQEQSCSILSSPKCRCTSQCTLQTPYSVVHCWSPLGITVLRLIPSELARIHKTRQTQKRTSTFQGSGRPPPVFLRSSENRRNTKDFRGGKSSDWGSSSACLYRL